MRLRDARPDEYPALTALALRSKAHWGYDDAFMAACRDELTVTGERDVIRVAEDAGELRGFYAVDNLGDHDVELYFMFVDPTSIGRGVGRMLLDHAVTAGVHLGGQRMLILSDPHAIPFYEKAGARQIGTRPSDSLPGRDLPLLALELP